jgi:hypothetical protein
LYQFYVIFYSESTQKLSCRNASACAVWLAKNFAH